MPGAAHPLIQCEPSKRGDVAWEIGMGAAGNPIASLGAAQRLIEQHALKYLAEYLP